MMHRVSVHRAAAVLTGFLVAGCVQLGPSEAEVAHWQEHYRRSAQEAQPPPEAEGGSEEDAPPEA